MIDGIPNRPLYFYQKDIVGSYPLETPDLPVAIFILRGLLLFDICRDQIIKYDRIQQVIQLARSGSKVYEHHWLMVWNMTFIFPYIGNHHPN